MTLKNMCYHPITIVNPTKYVSLSYRDRYLLRVPCGHCAECQELKQNEYYFRAYYHTQECLNNGGFVLFDTLTYRDSSLPRIRDFISVPSYNFPCFNSQHVRKFIAKLRQRCKRKYNSNFEFLLSSEYGTSQFHSHRPHYHILFFVSGGITPVELSKEISDCWIYGRTDGIPYQNRYHVEYNTLDGSSLSQSIRVLKYVTKYISKSSSFYQQIKKRVNAIVLDYYDMYKKSVSEQYAEQWLSSLECDKLRESLYRHMGQFHRQSTGFGLSFLEQADLVDIFDTSSLSVYDNNKVILNIPLPTYYKRKLFYEQVEVDNTLCWQPTTLGRSYLYFQQQNLCKRLSHRYTAAAIQCKLNIDVNSLVDYVVYKRGRIIADRDESTIEERLQSIDFYKYSTRYDRAHFGCLGVVCQWHGNSTQGYNSSKLSARLTLFSFGRRFSYFDEEKEKLLDIIDTYYINVDKNKQVAHDLKERARNVVKMVYG